MFNNLKDRIRHFKAEAYVLYLAMRHPGTPWYAKVFVAAIVAYAFSPVDLIPDFVPIIGYLDDMVIVAIGFTLAVKMIPPYVITECRLDARERPLKSALLGSFAGAVVVIIWLALAILCVVWAYRAFVSLTH